MKLKPMDRLRYSDHFQADLWKCIAATLLFVGCYWYFTKSRRYIDLTAYTIEVELIRLDYQKVYALPESYPTKQKLDKIIFELEYFYKNKKYQAKSTRYWEYLTPKFKRILEKGTLENLTVKCKKDAPEAVMVFVTSD